MPNMPAKIGNFGGNKKSMMSDNDAAASTSDGDYDGGSDGQ